MELLRSLLTHTLAVSLLLALWLGSRPTTRWTSGAGLAHWRLTRYWLTISWQWACVAVLLLLVPAAELAWLPLHQPWGWQAQPRLMFIVVGNLVVGLLGPVVLAWSSPVLRQRVLVQFAPVRSLLPTTMHERAVWIGLSITTGICEELLFRGFALQYLIWEPFGLSVGLSAFVSSLVFGLSHAYQGWRGVLRNLVFGAAMCVLLLETGNLALPMGVHILVNLRIALLPPPERLAPAILS